MRDSTEESGGIIIYPPPSSKLSYKMLHKFDSLCKNTQSIPTPQSKCTCMYPILRPKYHNLLQTVESVVYHILFSITPLTCCIRELNTPESK